MAASGKLPPAVEQIRRQPGGRLQGAVAGPGLRRCHPGLRGWPGGGLQGGAGRCLPLLPIPPEE